MSEIGSVSDQLGPLITEFVARKEQVLNLETRLYVLLFAVEVIFALFYIFWREKLRNDKVLALLALSVLAAPIFEMIAINGKMGLVSAYLRQLEGFLAAKGCIGMVWETKALGQIIFIPGNAFTLPAGLAILTMFFQAGYAIYFTLCRFFPSRRRAVILLVVICLLLAVVLLKAVTLDFARPLPNVFQ